MYKCLGVNAAQQQEQTLYTDKTNYCLLHRWIHDSLIRKWLKQWGVSVSPLFLPTVVLSSDKKVQNAPTNDNMQKAHREYLPILICDKFSQHLNLHDTGRMGANERTGTQPKHRLKKYTEPVKKYGESCVTTDLRSICIRILVPRAQFHLRQHPAGISSAPNFTCYIEYLFTFLSAKR